MKQTGLYMHFFLKDKKSAGLKLKYKWYKLQRWKQAKMPTASQFKALFVHNPHSSD
jgi:hypothetical protein